MTIELALPSDLEQRLRLAAARQNQRAEDVALQLLDEHLPPTQRMPESPCWSGGQPRTRL